MIAPISEPEFAPVLTLHQRAVLELYRMRLT